VFRRLILRVLLVSSMALSGASCFDTSDSPMDPTWGPQCPPGYVDSCGDDGTNCSCKRK